MMLPVFAQIVEPCKHSAKLPQAFLFEGFYEPHYIQRVFSYTQNPKKCYSTYHIEYLRPVHRALNVDEKKN